MECGFAGRAGKGQPSPDSGDVREIPRHPQLVAHLQLGQPPAGVYPPPGTHQPKPISKPNRYIPPEIPDIVKAIWAAQPPPRRLGGAGPGAPRAGRPRSPAPPAPSRWSPTCVPRPPPAPSRPVAPRRAAAAGGGGSNSPSGDPPGSTSKASAPTAGRGPWPSPAGPSWCRRSGTSSAGVLRQDARGPLVLRVGPEALQTASPVAGRSVATFPQRDRSGSRQGPANSAAAPVGVAHTAR